MKNTTESFALITGAGRGLGMAFARECARRGKSLILLDLDDARLELLGNHLRDAYQVRIVTRVVDLTDWTQLEELVHALPANYEISWLINNAGMGGTGYFERSELMQLDRLIQLNIRATVLLTRAVLPGMLARNAGLILNVASIAAFAPVPYKMIYPASKAFLLSFTQGLQEEYRQTGICIGSIHPGPIWTSYDAARRAMRQGWAGVEATQTAQRIARLAIERGLRGRSLIILGWLNKLQYLAAHWLPTRVYLRWSGNMIRRELVNLQKNSRK